MTEILTRQLVGFDSLFTVKRLEFELLVERWEGRWMTTFLFKRTVVTRMKTPARPLITLNTYCCTTVAGRRPRRKPGVDV